MAETKQAGKKSGASASTSKNSNTPQLIKDATNRPGVHSYVVSGTKFEVDVKYKPIKPIGHGAYGVVM